MAKPDVRDYVDLERYPIDQPDCDEYAGLVKDIQSDLARDGCAVLKRFIRADRIAELVAEADRTAPAAHKSFNRTNAYFSTDDDTFPASHPVRRFYERSNAFVPADNFGPDSILRQIYEWTAFAPFIKCALQEDNFYRYGDPLADVIVNVTEPGGGFPWHFDTNNYTVTLAIQNGDEGGLFEYCPDLRNPAEENYDGVQAVLDGDRGPVRSLYLEPGDLQIFKGRYSLHRVSEVGGASRRYVAIFSYAEEPDMIGRLERTRQLYGRVLPIHHEAEKRARADILRD